MAKPFDWHTVGQGQELLCDVVVRKLLLQESCLDALLVDLYDVQQDPLESDLSV